MIDCPVTRPLYANQFLDVFVLVDASAKITDEEIGQESDLLQQLYTELRIDGDDRRFGITAHGGVTASREFNRLRLAKTDDITTQQVRINDLEKIGGMPFLSEAIDAMEMGFDYSRRVQLVS
ncbi:hypothetical protein SNE40_003788 [Patella caerulea]|uniref:VWFA domain-containing protein n=1 Tax=Patella caerulea TaxID=87958 RepID=A0AAN8KAJ8_PATCE